MNKIKVLYIIVGVGGSDKALQNLLEEIEHDITPVILTNNIPKFVKDSKYQYYKTRYYFDSWPSRRSFQDLLKFPYRIIRNRIFNYLAYRKIISLCKSEKINIIHTNSGIFQFGFKAAVKLNIPHIWHQREHLDLLGIQPFPTYKSLLKKIRDKRNFSVAITKGVFQHYALNNNAKVIYDGVMKKSHVKLNKTKANYYLFVGAQTKQKGYDLVIKAYIDYLKNGNSCELWIAAENLNNGFTNSITNYIIQSGYEQKIKFLGFRKDIPNLMLNAKALLATSRSEGFGLIVAEAMFLGCLVVANNNTGIKEQLDNGFKSSNSEIGIRFQSQEELTKILTKIDSNDYSSYTKMITNAHKTASALYSTENNAKQILDVYSQLLNINYKGS